MPIDTGSYNPNKHKMGRIRHFTGVRPICDDPFRRRGSAVKNAAEIKVSSAKNVLYIMDEPTTGLHVEDIKKLLAILQKLVNSGNTVVVVEHNLDVIKTADWIIDLGPEGGATGGQIVAEGRPEQEAKVAASYMGQFLAQALECR